MIRGGSIAFLQTSQKEADIMDVKGVEVAPVGAEQRLVQLLKIHISQAANGLGKFCILVVRCFEDVVKFLKSPPWRKFSWYLVEGYMQFPGVFVVGLLNNDTSFWLQSDVAYVEQNHGHMLLGTVKSRVAYPVLAVSELSIWVSCSCFRRGELLPPSLYDLGRLLRGFLAGLLMNDVSYLLQNDVSYVERNHGHVLWSNLRSKVVYLLLAVFGFSPLVWHSWCKAQAPFPAYDERYLQELINAKLQSLHVTDESRPDIESGRGTSTPSTPSTATVTMTFVGVSPELLTMIKDNLKPDITTSGSKVLHKRFDFNPHQTPRELDNCISQIAMSLKLAHDEGADCVLQLGSYAVFKYTDEGPQMFKLREEWPPTIIDIQRQWTILNYLSGDPAKWIIKGKNLLGASLKAATENAKEDLGGLLKSEGAVDILICNEPHLIKDAAPRFKEKVFITASKVQEVQMGMNAILQSKAKDVQRAYQKSVIDFLIPGRWITILSIAISALGRLNPHQPIEGGLHSGSGRGSIESYLRIGLDYYTALYLVYLFTIVVISSWAPLFRGMCFAIHRVVELATFSSRPHPENPPARITQVNHSVYELHRPEGRPNIQKVMPERSVGVHSSSPPWRRVRTDFTAMRY